MKRLYLLLLGIPVLGMGCKNKNDVFLPMSVAGIITLDSGKTLKLLISPLPLSDTLGILCGEHYYLDTVVIPRDYHGDTLEYILDSTFLLTCKDHSKIPLLDGSDKMLELEMNLIITEPDSGRVVIAGKDTIYLGDTVRTSAYVKVQRYAGGIYAPIPPSGYTDRLPATSGDTLVVWIDYDRDSTIGYDEGDVFGVALLNGDSTDVRILTRAIEVTPIKFYGYRGLDLCFRCTR